jgi:hypothetical protein
MEAIYYVESIVKVTNSFYFCYVLFFFLIVSPIHATQITESVYATVSDTSGVSELTAGTTYHVFDVTYDDQSTASHMYYLDGTIYTTHRALGSEIMAADAQ